MINDQPLYCLRWSVSGRGGDGSVGLYSRDTGTFCVHPSASRTATLGLRQDEGGPSPFPTSIVRQGTKLYSALCSITIHINQIIHCKLHVIFSTMKLYTAVIIFIRLHI